MPPNAEQIAKSTMEIPHHDLPSPYMLTPGSYIRPDNAIEKMQADIQTLSNEVEALRDELTFSTLAFLVASLAICITLILKFTGVI